MSTSSRSGARLNTTAITLAALALGCGQTEPTAPRGPLVSAAEAQRSTATCPLPPTASTATLRPESYESGPFSSENSNVSTVVHFSNATCQTVRIIWYDFIGLPVLYNILGPGESYEQPTFLTHPWIVVGDQTGPMGVFLPTPATSTVYINSPVGTPRCDSGTPGCSDGYLVSAGRPPARQITVCVSINFIPLGWLATSLTRDAALCGGTQPFAYVVARYSDLRVGSILNVCGFQRNALPSGWQVQRTNALPLNDPCGNGGGAIQIKRVS